jgi:PAS domain-containing protein
MANIHENIVIKIGVNILSTKVATLHELGELLISNNSDDLSSGGIWIWDYATSEVYYSPKFCEILGYDYGELCNGFGGFDRGDKANMAYGMKLINNLIEENLNENFINTIKFKKKDESDIIIQCTGTVLYRYGKPYIVLGTHKIL